MDTPVIRPFTEEQIELRNLVREIVKNEVIPVRTELDEKEEFPTDIVASITEAGLFATMYEEKYGGLGMGMMSSVILSEELGYGCLGVATTVLASRLGSLPIDIGGTEEQKERWLPQMASGEKLGAFGLSEPGAGSDVPGMQTTAVKKGDRWVLNGTKQWISNAGQADIYTVFAVTNKNRGTRGISCFVVEKGTPGFSFGKKENKLGIRSSETRQLIFEDCEIPEENLLGVQDRGFMIALKTLNISRISVAAAGVGLGQAALDASLEYARQREQFGQKISSFQALQHMMADMAMKIEAGRLITYRAAQMMDDKHPDMPLHSAMAKAYTADAAMEITTNAVQIFGGYGFVKEYPVEKFFRDAKILQIYEGTSQIQRNEIAAGLIKQSAKGLR